MPHQTGTQTHTEAGALRMARDSRAIAEMNLPAPSIIRKLTLSEERLHGRELGFELGDHGALQFGAHANGS